MQCVICGKDVIRKGNRGSIPKYCSYKCYKRDWSAKHPESGKLYNIKYHQKVKEKIAIDTKKYRKNNPKAYKAYNKLVKAKQFKKIESKPCMFCGNVNTIAHHEDYNNPLEILWICRKHHNFIHQIKKNERFLCEKEFKDVLTKCTFCGRSNSLICKCDVCFNKDNREIRADERNKIIGEIEKRFFINKPYTVGIFIEMKDWETLKKAKGVR